MVIVDLANVQRECSGARCGGVVPVSSIEKLSVCGQDQGRDYPTPCRGECGAMPCAAFSGANGVPGRIKRLIR